MTTVNSRSLTTNIVINGISIPVISWQCHLTSYGNLCTFEVTTSIKKAKALIPDIFTLCNNNATVECDIFLSDSAAGTSGLVFSGIIDTVNGEWDDDILEITGRDYSAVLRDQQTTLDKYVNMTVSQVVTGIAQQAGISIMQDGQSTIQISDQIAGIQASTFQGIDWSYSTSPKPLWHILQELAEEVDCIVFMDRLKTLHFVSPGVGGKSQSYSWRPTQTSNAGVQGPSNQNPIMKLSIMQQGRRCNNFTLFLHGYNRDGKQTIYYQKDVGSGGRIIHKSRQDLNSTNMTAIANALAEEIQRKNTTLKMVVEGNLNLNVNDTIQVYEAEEADLLGLSGRNLYVSSVLHSFSMPDYGSEEGDGFLTHVTCNQLGAAGASDE